MSQLGVCSWSLCPSGPAELVERVRACGLDAVQLHLDPLLPENHGGSWRWDEATTARTLGDAGITVLSGMMGMRGEDYSSLDAIRRTGGVRPDEHWEANLAAARANAGIAARLGLRLVTFHAGFLPEEAGDPVRAVMLERLRAVADAFAAEGVDVAFETGQESAATLLGVLDELDRPRAGVNFDPANMILYDMGEPVAALHALAPRVRQVHVKDATRTSVAGAWGSEVVAGTGEVDWPAFFAVLAEHARDVDLVIEREAGESRVEDVRAARALVEGLRSSSGGPGIGVVGLGFMGRTHLAAWRDADAAGFANRVVAVCDGDAERRAGRVGGAGNLEPPPDDPSAPAFDPAAVNTYARAEDLLADPAVDVVSICTPTDTHVDLAVRTLEAGKHVLVEKPIATELEPVQRLAAAARASDRVCLPALCIRFWPAWSWLRERVVDGSLGGVRSAAFRRLGSAPGWNRAFYGDAARSGGALFDLHVHDADFVRWCFGMPDSVASAGTLDHVTTLYRYGDGPAHVTAEGGWDHAPGFPFTMSFVVVFERATADYRLGRYPELVLASSSGGGDALEPVPLEPWAGYDGEVRHLLDLVAGRADTPHATVEDAVLHTRLLLAEGESLRTRAAVPLA